MLTLKWKNKKWNESRFVFKLFHKVSTFTVNLNHIIPQGYIKLIKIYFLVYEKFRERTFRTNFIQPEFSISSTLS